MGNCTRCGAILQEQASFCEYCGAPVERQAQRSGAEAPAESGQSAGNRFLDQFDSAGPKRASMKRVSVMGMMVLTFLTFGLYPALWTLLRRRSFDGMSQGTKIGRILPLVLLLAACASLALGNDGLLDLGLPRGDADTAAAYSILAYFAISAALCFRCRRILREYASRMDTSSLAASMVARSSLWTLVFQQLYIQHHINLLIEAGLLSRRN